MNIKALFNVVKSIIKQALDALIKKMLFMKVIWRMWKK